MTQVDHNALDFIVLYENNSLDFVLIDASHKYIDVKEDIISWLPKVKKGGYLIGDDYLGYDKEWWYKSGDGKKDKILKKDGKVLGHFGVNSAVDEFTLDKGIKLNQLDDKLDSATAASTYGSKTGELTTVTVGALNAGSITSGFTSIDVGDGAISTTGAANPNEGVTIK